MNRQGHVNGSFHIDIDKIEVVASNSSHSDLNSMGSQSVLTDVHTNFRFTQPETPENRSRVSTPSNMMRRWSQNVSKLGRGRKSGHEKTERSSPTSTVFAGDDQPVSSDDEVQQLAKEIGRNDYLMQDNASGENLRMSTIRALPHSLATKKRLKEILSVSVSQNSVTDASGFFRRVSRNVSVAVSYLTRSYKNSFTNVELWYNAMKEIEGHFGSSVGAYFKFLRWLFILDFVLLVFTFFFIAFPQMIYSAVGEEVPQLKNPTNLQSSFRLMDMITGEGYLKDSILFYGAYTNDSFPIGSPRQYSLPQAYFMTMMCLYIFTFVVISVSMARSYRKSFIETSGGVRHMCAHKIFCSWDYSISNANAAKMKQASIFVDLKDYLHEIAGYKPKLSKMWRVWTFCSQVTANLLVAAMLAGLGAAMWIILQFFGETKETSSWQTLYLPVSVIITILIFQMFFSWIARIEDYKSTERSLHITLMRNFMLEGVIVGVLIVFWLNKDHAECWENSIGQEVYRLVLVDFFITVIVSTLVQFIRVHVCLKFWPGIGKPEFDISRKSLGLVLNQTILWVGVIFSPLLALVVVIKMILTFYIKKTTLIYLCKAPSQVWRSAQTQTLYLVMTFLSLLGVVVALGYIMTQKPVSQKCGPFRNHDFMFQIFIEGVLELKSHHWIWRAITAIARPAVMGGLLLTMAVIVYYLRSKSHGRQAMVKLLKDMLYMEAKDKEFLLLNISRLTHNREWLFNDENVKGSRSSKDNFIEHSSTWRYQSGNTQDDSRIRCRHV